MKSIPSIIILWLCSWFIAAVNAQGNTSCQSGSTSLDWYTNSVGETPCQTYQRMRQICNSNYVVGSLSLTSAPDVCNDQVSGCCCNSISYALLMLCLNCQQDKGQATPGFDGSPGLYEAYLDNCTPVYNQTLPKDIQWAVCNNKIKIFDDLYSLFWTTGAWYYVFTMETIQKDQQAFANNTFTHCTSTTIDNSTTSASGSTAATSSSASSTGTGSADPSSHANASMSADVIGGIAAGSVTALLVVGMLVWFFRRRASSEYSYNVVHTVEPFSSVSPYAATTSYSDARSSIDPPGNNYPPVLLPESAPQRPFSQSDKVRAVISQPLNQNHPRPSTSQTPTSVSVSTWPLTTTEALTEHADRGPLLIARSASDRLPPAYGEKN